jgi:hypothetical protein
MKEEEEEEQTQVERQPGKEGTDDSELKKTRVGIPGLY